MLVITAPYLLGRLADRLGLTTAFTIEPVLIGLCLLLLLAGLRARRTGAQPPPRDNCQDKKATDKASFR